MKIIKYGGQNISQSDIDEVKKSLKNDLITTGPYVKKFEDKLRNFTECKYALTTSSGTSAIHLSLLSLQLKKNATIIMPAVNFISSYSMSKNLGLKVYLADVDPVTGQMTPKNVLDCIKKNSIKKLNCFITMYLGGFAENIKGFYKIKKLFNCYWIEDACHALGASYNFNSKVFKMGSGKHSSICTFSFHPLKTITTGEGGLLTTNNKKIYNRVLELRSHGIAKKDYWTYDIKKLSFNYRLSDLNCSLGLSQLRRIKKFILKRKKIYKEYKKKLILKNLYDFPKYSSINHSAHHLFILNLKLENLKITKNIFLKNMLKKGILLQQHYIPIFNYSFFSKTKKNYKKKFSNSIKYFESAVSLPIHYNLSYKKQIKVINTINKFLKNNQKKNDFLKK